MKCYTTLTGKLQTGINTVEYEKLGQVVFLGEEGRGRRYAKVGLFRRNPAQVGKDGLIHDAHPVKIIINKGTDKEKEFYVLAKPDKTDHRILVRINTSAVYTRNTVGKWQTISGNPETIVSGYGAHGEAGRIGNWDDGLVIMHPGDVIRVKPEGGHKTSPYALFYSADNGLQTMAWDEYEAYSAEQNEEAEIEMV